MTKKFNRQKFISSCSLTFKSFNYHVHENINKKFKWNFTAEHPQTGKKYTVLCTDNVSTNRPIIKNCLSKLQPDHKFVVVGLAPSKEEIEEGLEKGYTVISQKTLSKFANQMMLINIVNP